MTKTLYSGCFRSLLVAGALFSSILSAQTPSYFPLQAGNLWVYQYVGKGNTGSATYRTISVDRQETIAGRDYFDVTYLGRQVLLREDPTAGMVIAYDRESATEQPWLSLGLPEGATFPTSLDLCTDTGKIVSRAASLTTPAGAFENVVQVGYQGHCADAGITTQLFAPSVGMVAHEETSIAGPRRWELVYYRSASAGDTGRELSFTMGLDSTHYQPLTPMKVRLTLRSTLAETIHLQFPSGQSFDLKIVDVNGNGGYQWSANKTFAMIFRDESFGPGERTYSFTADLPNLAPGHYKAQAYLTTNPIQYQAEVAFDIVAAGKSAADDPNGVVLTPFRF